MRTVFLGPPGCGKGTQAKRLQKPFKLVHLAAGDLLRSAIKQGTPEGKQVETYVNNGHLVPDALVIALMIQRIKDTERQAGFIMDGFPRTVHQAEALEAALESLKKPLDFAASFELNHSLLLERLSGRRICPNGHGEWHVKFNPPPKKDQCPVCQEDLIQRADDHQEKIRIRLAAYHKETLPLKVFYQQRNLLRTIEADGDLDAVTQRLVSLFGA